LSARGYPTNQQALRDPTPTSNTSMGTACREFPAGCAIPPGEPPSARDARLRRPPSRALTMNRFRCR
jgi:hypothetical protein